MLRELQKLEKDEKQKGTNNTVAISQRFKKNEKFGRKVPGGLVEANRACEAELSYLKQGMFNLGF